MRPITVGVRVDLDTHAQLLAGAAAQGVHHADLIREWIQVAIMRYRCGKPMRPTFDDALGTNVTPQPSAATLLKVAPAPGEPAPAPPKRKVGRPRKADSWHVGVAPATVDALKRAADATDVAGIPVKRKPGRPRKQPREIIDSGTMVFDPGPREIIDTGAMVPDRRVVPNAKAGKEVAKK